MELEAGPAATNPGPRAVLRRYAPSATRQRTLEANGIDCGAGPVFGRLPADPVRCRDEIHRTRVPVTRPRSPRAEKTLARTSNGPAATPAGSRGVTTPVRRRRVRRAVATSGAPAWAALTRSVASPRADSDR